MGYEANTSTTTVEDAIVALSSRGVSGGVSVDLGSGNDPAFVMRWCRWWDDQLENGNKVGAGLIVQSIRLGEDPPRNESRTRGSKDAELERLQAERRAKFAAVAARFPVGAVTEEHAVAERRRLRRRDVEPPPEDELCPGGLVVIDTSGMVLTARCDECGEETTYPWRALGVLPDRPLLSHCPEPPRPPVVPAGPMAARLQRSLRRFNPNTILNRGEKR